MTDMETPAGRVAAYLDARKPYGGRVIASVEGPQKLMRQLRMEDVRALLNERELLLDELAKTVVAATEFGHDGKGFASHYLMPISPLTRITTLLEQRGVVVRPGFDGRRHPDLAPNQPALADRTNR